MPTVLREHFEYTTLSQYSIFGHLIRFRVQTVHSDEHTNNQIKLIQAFLENYQCETLLCPVTYLLVILIYCNQVHRILQGISTLLHCVAFALIFIAVGSLEIDVRLSINLYKSWNLIMLPK